MRRGDVRWYKFDRPDKSRPVVILTRDSIIPHIGEVSAAPVTSTIRDIPSEVLLDRKDGVAKECAINCDHLQTIAKSRIGPLLTRLSNDRMREIHDAVNFALSLDE